MSEEKVSNHFTLLKDYCSIALHHTYVGLCLRMELFFFQISKDALLVC